MILEAVPAPLGQLVAEAVKVPVIGIGAGPNVDGQGCYNKDIGRTQMRKGGVFKSVLNRNNVSNMIFMDKHDSFLNLLVPNVMNC